MLADECVHLVFTGTYANQSINMITPRRATAFYDSRLHGLNDCGPSVIRHVHIENKSTVRFKTIPAPDFGMGHGRQNCKEYLSDLFDNMILICCLILRDNPYNVFAQGGRGRQGKMCSPSSARQAKF
jgi:hypothetical protein